MTSGFLEEYYALEYAYHGHIKDIPDDKLKALRMRYPEKSRRVRSEHKYQAKEELSDRMIQIQDLWKRGLVVDEMAKETNLAVKSIRMYLAQLGLPANSIYHYQIKRGDEVRFARSIRELAGKLSIKYKGSRTNIRKKAKEQGWELYYGDWREPEVKRENGK